MTTRSPLERDIESREMTKKPLGALIFIAILSICLGALGVYTYSLKHELMLSRQELAITKDISDKKIEYLMNKVKELEKETGDNEHIYEDKDPGKKESQNQ